VQRIGLATSDNLIHWKKHPANPLIVADPRWYELLDLNVWHDQAWRDPWVTARVNHGPADGRGVIGHARSSDLIHWQVLPPLTEMGEFGHLEVPQLTYIRGRYYLLFCAIASVHSAARRQRTGLKPTSGTHYLVADAPLGPFRFSSDEFVVGDEVGSLYAGKLAQGPDGDWVFVASRMFTPDGTFVGELSDPFRRSSPACRTQAGKTCS
jgi:beta-fructofuranosidase